MKYRPNTEFKSLFGILLKIEQYCYGTSNNENEETIEKQKI